MEEKGDYSEEELPKLSLIEHLEELRKRIFLSLVAVSVVFIFALFYSEKIFNLIALPLKKYLPEGSELVFTRLQEPFTLYVKVSFVSAVIISFPFILYQIWLYISPGLYRREKKVLLSFFFFSLFLFLGGILFAYFILFPNTCSFLLEIGKSFTPMISITEYFNLAIFVILGVGVVFQIPIIITVLSYFGILSPKFLIKNSRFAIFLIFLVAAVLSPTVDVVNLFVFALPMVFLYLISILLSFFFYGK